MIRDGSAQVMAVNPSNLKVLVSRYEADDTCCELAEDIQINRPGSQVGQAGSTPALLGT
jgi:hypothetical protein